MELYRDGQDWTDIMTNVGPKRSITSQVPVKASEPIRSPTPILGLSIYLCEVVGPGGNLVTSKSKLIVFSFTSFRFSTRSIRIRKFGL